MHTDTYGGAGSRELARAARCSLACGAAQAKCEFYLGSLITACGDLYPDCEQVAQASIGKIMYHWGFPQRGGRRCRGQIWDDRVIQAFTRFLDTLDQDLKKRLQVRVGLQK